MPGARRAQLVPPANMRDFWVVFGSRHSGLRSIHLTWKCSSQNRRIPRNCIFRLLNWIWPKKAQGSLILLRCGTGSPGCHASSADRPIDQPCHPPSREVLVCRRLPGRCSELSRNDQTRILDQGDDGQRLIAIAIGLGEVCPRCRAHSQKATPNCVAGARLRRMPRSYLLKASLALGLITSPQSPIHSHPDWLFPENEPSTRSKPPATRLYVDHL